MGNALASAALFALAVGVFVVMWVQHRIRIYRDLLRHTAYQRILRKYRRRK